MKLNEPDRITEGTKVACADMAAREVRVMSIICTNATKEELRSMLEQTYDAVWFEDEYIPESVAAVMRSDQAIKKQYGSSSYLYN